MSGQPFNNPSDKEKYVNAYKANLKLRIKLNEDQLQASRLFKKTGEVSSIKTDNRTITEKLADLNKLKLNLFTDLTKITTQDQIPLIMQNLSDDDITFLAQHFDEIASQIKPKYKLGVPAPIFVNYLNHYIQNAIDTNEINGGLQQTSLNKMILSLQQIQTQMINKNDLDSLYLFIQRNGERIQGSSKSFITAKINELQSLLPTKEELTNLQQIQNEDIKNSIQREISEAVKDLPNKNDIKRYLLSLTSAIGANDRQQTAIILSKIADVLTADQGTKDLLMQAKEDIQREIKKEGIATRNYSKLINLNLLAVIGQSAAKQAAAITDQLKVLTDLTAQQKNQITTEIISALNTNQIKTQEQLDLATSSIIEKVQEEGNLNRSALNVVKVNLTDLIGESEARQKQVIITGVKLLKQLTQEQQDKILEEILKLKNQVQTQEQLNTLIESVVNRVVSQTKGQAPSGQAAEEPPMAEARVMAEALPPPEDRNAKRARKFMKDDYLSYDEITPSGTPNVSNNDKYIDKILNNSDLMRSINPEDPTISKSALFKKLTNYKSGNFGLERQKAVIEEINRRIRVIAFNDPDLQTATDQVGRTIGKGIRGKGLYRNKIIAETDFNKGIREGQKYTPFGRYYINNHHLNDNIISIRRNNGSNVVGFPNVRVSNNLGNVFRTIVGKGKTNFSELEKINDDEKKYLHKLSKHSNILTRLDIPTPDKDKDDIEMNKFEIMKGEILSGNDNKEYIKNFKLQIIKLMKSDLLPKDQALEILSDLAALGY